MVLLEPAAIVAGEPDRITGLRRLYVCLTRAVTSLVIAHAEPLPAELRTSDPRLRSRTTVRGKWPTPFVAGSTARQQRDRKDTDMTATIAVHEFISADGVFESPTWTFEFGFDPKMGETLAAITEGSNTILLGRRTHEMFAPAWRDRTVEDDPGPTSSTRPRISWSGPASRPRSGTTPPVWVPTTPTRSAASRRSATGSSTSRAADSWSAACSRDGLVDDAAPVRLPDRARRGREVLGRGRAEQAHAQGARRLRQRRRAPGVRPRLRSRRPTRGHAEPVEVRFVDGHDGRARAATRRTSSSCSPTTTASTGSTYPCGTSRPSRC